MQGPVETDISRCFRRFRPVFDKAIIGWNVEDDSWTGFTRHALDVYRSAKPVIASMRHKPRSSKDAIETVIFRVGRVFTVYPDRVYCNTCKISISPPLIDPWFGPWRMLVDLWCLAADREVALFIWVVRNLPHGAWAHFVPKILLI